MLPLHIQLELKLNITLQYIQDRQTDILEYLRDMVTVEI